MNEIQAIQRNEFRRQCEQIREMNAEIQAFFREYPFCSTCGTRAPKKHKCGPPWDTPLFGDDDD